MSLTPRPRSRSGSEPDELLIFLEAKGHHGETLVDLVQGLIELSPGPTPYGMDIWYEFNTDFDSTIMIFKGVAWIYEIAHLVKRFRANGIPVRGWSNWSLPFIEALTASIPELDPVLDKLTLGVPFRGNLAALDLYIQQKVAVEKEEADEGEETDTAIAEEARTFFGENLDGG